MWQEISVLVQFKTKRCITAENKRPFFKRKSRIMQNTSKVEKFNLSGVSYLAYKNAEDLVLHHLLLIARHYIYTCKQRDTRPNVQMYIEIA